MTQGRFAIRDPWSGSDSRSGLINHRDTADGNQQSLWYRDCHGHPSRRIIRKEFSEKAVEFRKVGDIGDKNGGVYDQVEPATSSPQNGVEILKRLPGLNIKGRASRFASRRVNTWLSGYEQQASRAHSLGIRPDRLQSRNFDHLFT